MGAEFLGFRFSGNRLLGIFLLFITLISKNLAGLSVQTVMNRKINCHRSFNGAGRLE